MVTLHCRKRVIHLDVKGGGCVANGEIDEIVEIAALVLDVSGIAAVVGYHCRHAGCCKTVVALFSARGLL